MSSLGRRAAPERCFDFVADVTYPDGTVVKPGEKIVKTWRFECVCLMGSRGKKARRVSGSFGPEEFPLPDAEFGQRIDVSTEITVPTKSGTHRATYRIYNREGLTAGGGFWVEVRVA